MHGPLDVKDVNVLIHMTITVDFWPFQQWTPRNSSLCLRVTARVQIVVLLGGYRYGGAILSFTSILKLSPAGTDLVNLQHRHKHLQSVSPEKRTRQACLCYFLCNRLYVRGTKLRVGPYCLIKLAMAIQSDVRYWKNTAQSQNEKKKKLNFK